MKIIYANEQGGVSIVWPVLESGLTLEEIISQNVPKGAEYEIVEDGAIPADRTFRGAWEKVGSEIATNISKAKEISHEFRRETRAKEFAPFDVQATIPSLADKAELERQKIREKYSNIQNEIDSAVSEEVLKTIHKELENVWIK